MNRMEFTLKVLTENRDECRKVNSGDSRLDNGTPYKAEIEYAFSKMEETFDHIIEIFELMQTTIGLSTEFVEDVLPQAGRLAIQRFDNLNQLCMNMTELHATVEEDKDAT